MADLLGVSPSTVRRDLNELQGQGLIERMHGGAMSVGAELEPLRPVREIANAAAKQRIGRAAAAHVRDRSTILILGGTTTEAMLPFLGSVRELTVVTNSILVVNRLAQQHEIDLVVLGGLLRRREMSLLGHLTIAAIAEFGIDQVYTSAFGIDPALGVTGTDLAETQTDRTLTAAAAELILLADHSKLRQRGPARLVPIASVSRLITDDEADADAVAALVAAGVEVETC